EAVKFMQAFWKECCDEGGLAWDDTNNNRAFHAGEISATLNGASIYIVAKRQKEKIKDEKGEPLFQDIDHAPLPARPGGSYLLFLNQSNAIRKYSQNQKLAKDFLTWLHKTDNYGKWFASQEGYSVGATKKWENDPMWGKLDEPLKMFRTAARNTRLFGYAGPSTAKATEGFTKYIITDMYAKAVQGLSAEDAVKWAETELRKIYEAYSAREDAMDRRGFLKTTGVAGILASGRAPAFAQGTKLHLLRWVDFVPAGDQVLRQQLLPEAGKALGVEVQLETINANDLQPRITAAIQSGSGADIIMTLHNWPHLYKSATVDVTDVAEGIAKDQGGFYGQSEQAVKDGKQFLAVPWGISGLLIAYR